MWRLEESSGRDFALLYYLAPGKLEEQSAKFPDHMEENNAQTTQQCAEVARVPGFERTLSRLSSMIAGFWPPPP